MERWSESAAKVQRAALAKAQAAAEAEQSRNNKLSLLAVIGIMAILALVQLPTAIMLTIAGMPGVMAATLDASETRSLTKKILLLDLAVVLPYLGYLWGGRNDWVAAEALLEAPSTWFTIYAAAAFAWLLHRTIPLLMAAVLTALLERRRRKIVARMKELESIWGEEVGRS